MGSELDRLLEFSSPLSEGPGRSVLFFGPRPPLGAEGMSSSLPLGEIDAGRVSTMETSFSKIRGKKKSVIFWRTPTF